MKKLLVTGASGFLGWNICKVAKADWDVIGLSYSHGIPINGIEREQCDSTDFRALDSLFKKLRPDAVIHAAAISDPNYCEAHARESWRVNVEASEHIASLCKAWGARLAFTSTDLVFDGNNPPYNEADPVDPINRYGEQKVQAEIRMRRKNEKILICRLPLMFGDHPGPAKSFIQPMIENIVSGRPMTLFIDEFRTPVSAQDAARGILGFIETQTGLIHLGGKKSISRFDFGMLLGKCLGLQTTSINPSFQKDMNMPAQRPKNVALDSKMAYSLGYSPDEPETAIPTLECIKRAKLISAAEGKRELR
jgi:dTDP-4-dehydrorhamnose reductase